VTQTSPSSHSPSSQAEPQDLHLSGLGAIAENYDLILCDVWGVVHNGLTPHAGSLDALQRFRAKGGRVVLISNAPVPAGSVRHRLDRLPVPRKTYDAIVTSGDVIVSLIVERGDAPIFNIGPSYDRSLYQAVNKLRGATPRRVRLPEASYVVCTGLTDPDREEPKDYDTLLQSMLEKGLDFLCANPDIVVHVGPKLMFCAGAIAERYASIGGKVIQGGKPYAPIYERALGLGSQMLGRSVEKSRVLAIGDAMQTDIKGAREQTIASLFIASGIHQDELMKTGKDGCPSPDGPSLERLFAATGFAPDFIMAGLRW